MNIRKANFKTYNRMRWILLSSAAFYAGFAYVCIKYSILINWETYSTGGKIFALTAGLCLLYFLIWLIAVGTESIEVKDGKLTVRYLLFYKRTYSLRSISEAFVNDPNYYKDSGNFAIGIYINGKRLVLPIQPHGFWKNFNLWFELLISLKVKFVIENDTIELWPFGVIGKRKIPSDPD